VTPYSFLAMASAFVAWGGGLGLAAYLDLHVRARKGSGALPPSTPVLFSGFMVLDVEVLYGREYRELDELTRRLVPLIRVLLPTGFALIAGMLAWAYEQPPSA